MLAAKIPLLLMGVRYLYNVNLSHSYRRYTCHKGSLVAPDLAIADLFLKIPDGQSLPTLPLYIFPLSILDGNTGIWLSVIARVDCS